MLAANSSGEQFKKVFEAHIPELRIGPLVEELFATDWPLDSFIMQHLTHIGATHLVAEPWIEDMTSTAGGAVQKLREVTMQVPLPPAPMCPTRSRMTSTFRIKVSPSHTGEQQVEVLCSSLSHDVPFGDKFVVQERLHFAPVSGGVVFQKSGRCVFLKSCGVLQSRIRAHSVAQLSSAGEKMASLLQSRSAAPGSTCTVRIYELQRRVTIFSQRWLPPFLPHDGRKRWRWVDSSYGVHAWTAADSREASAQSSVPPLQPREGWVQQSSWQVVRGTGDEDGWQYAIDFYHKERYWGSCMQGRHVRRRLWTCVFVESPEAA